MSPGPYLSQHIPPRSKMLPLAREISFSLPTAPLEGRRGGGCCAAAKRNASVAGPRRQRCSAAKREEDATIPGMQESCESSAGTLDISLPGWADPPCRKPLYTLINKLFTQTKRASTITGRDLFLGAQSRLSTNSPLQHKAGDGGAGSLVCSLPARLFPHPKGLCPSLPKHPAWDSSGKPSKTFAWSNTRRSLQLCKPDSKRLCHRACDFADKRQNSRQQFLPIKPCCPDPEGLVSQVSQRQPEHSLILLPSDSKKIH